MPTEVVTYKVSGVASWLMAKAVVEGGFQVTRGWSPQDGSTSGSYDRNWEFEADMA